MLLPRERYRQCGWKPLVLAVLVVACERGDSDGRAILPVEVTLHPYVGQLVTIDAVVKGDTIRLILDTGGGQTLVSPAAASKAGCAISGHAVGYRMTGERVDYDTCSDLTLSIGGVDYPHAVAGVWDVQALLPEGVPPVDGVLSLKTLQDQPFTLDLADRTLTLESAASLARRVSGMQRLRSRIASGTGGDELTVLLQAAVPDTSWLLLDSGNLDVLLLAPHRARQAAAGTVDSLSRRNPSEEWIQQIVVPGLPPLSVTARVRDIIYDGVLSEEIIRQWVLAFNLRDNEVWGAPR